MHISGTALLTLAALFATGSARCYLEGQNGHWGKDLAAIQAIKTACNNLTGHYIPGESRQVCIQGKDTIKWIFELKVKPQSYLFTHQILTKCECSVSGSMGLIWILTSA